MSEDTVENAVSLKFVEDAYLAASGQMSWADFMGNFSAFPAIKISLVQHNANFDEFGTVIPHNFDPVYVQSYLDYYKNINPKAAFTQEMASQPEGSWGHKHVQPKIMERTEYYNDWLKPQGNLGGGHGITLLQNNKQYISLISQFSFEHMDEAHKAVNLVQSVRKHIGRALELQNTLHHQKVTSRSYEHVLNCLHNPVVVTNTKGQLFFANHKAEALFQKGDLITLGRDKVMLFKDHFHEKMAKQQLATLTLNLESEERLHLRLKTAEGSFITLFASPLTITPLEVGNFETFWKAPRHIAWFFIMPHPIVSLDYKIIAAVLNVSATEAKLAHALAQNYSLQQYADMRNVKITTARVQLRELRRKTNTGNQAELVGLINQVFGMIDL